MPDETTRQPRTVGIVGAGTMGAGIAQLAAAHGFDVLLFDTAPGQAGKARARIADRLARATDRGQSTTSEDAATLDRVRPVERLEELAAVDVVIEAAPEELDLKRALFARLAEICAPECLLVSNTSSLSITSIATGAHNPYRIAGMHFFNPAPVMPLVEIIAGDASSEATLTRTEELARRLGKTPLRVRDTPGFLVNRLARPYYGEALRIVADGTATVPEVDRVMRAYGFALGPFELLDLIGLEVNLAVTRTIYDATFHEPRFRPHRLQVQMVAAGKLGRKTGQGFYRYPGDRREDLRNTGVVVPPPGVPRASGVLVAGQGRVADDLALALSAAEHNVTIYAGEVSAALEHAGIPRARRLRDLLFPIDIAIEATVGPPELKRAHWYELDDALPADVPILTSTHARGVTEVASWSAHPGRVVGFGFAGTLESAPTVELARGTLTTDGAIARAVALFQHAGKPITLVGDPPGQVASRMLSMLVNEACFALSEGIAENADIDTAPRLGLNFPRGPLAWGDQLGLETVVATLDGLHTYFGDERYRVAPSLRRALYAGRSLVDSP